MIKEFIGIGSTIEAATDAARAGLNAPELADVHTEVVEMPKKKVLGLFGGNDAKVKAWFDDGKKEPAPKKAKKPSAPKAQKPAPKKEQKPAPKAKTPANTEKKEAPKPVSIPDDFNVEPVKAYLAEMIKGFNVEDAVIEANIVDSTIEMEIKCEDYGIIIGHRGETLDALQYLTSLYVRKLTEKSLRVTINVGNYREKRVETLKNLAKKNASYVARSGRRYTFEPMNPFERRVIHTTIQEIEGVESKSIGYNQDRRVVLEPTGGVRGGYSNSRGNYRGNSRPQSTTSRPANVQPKADRADLPKFSKIEVNKD